MLWQFAHVISFSWCLPDVQNARLRLPEWQFMQTPVRSSAVWPLPNGLAGFAFVGSLRCSLASPWHAWHMLPFASFFAPWAVRSIAFHSASWQLAQTGAVCAPVPAEYWAKAGVGGTVSQAATTNRNAAPVTVGSNRMALPFFSVKRRKLVASAEFSPHPNLTPAPRLQL